VGEQGSFSRTLEPFTGINVILEAIDDAEAERFMGELAFVLAGAKWKISRMQRVPGSSLVFAVGVEVQANGALFLDEKGNVLRDDTEPAKEVLINEFSNRDILVNSRPAFPSLPLHTILIRVGARPTRLSREIDKQLKERLKDLERRREEGIRQFEEKQKVKKPD
jgi:hypothetical protein